MLSQINYWIKIKQRGYPNLFQSLKEYEQFSHVIKQLAQEWNLPIDSIYVQGSSLRIENAADIGDLDIAIKVNAEMFESLVDRFKGNTTSSGRNNIIEREAEKGKISGVNMFLNIPNSKSITGKFYDDFQTQFKSSFQQKLGIDKIQISIIKENSSLDINPYLKLK